MATVVRRGKRTCHPPRPILLGRHPRVPVYTDRDRPFGYPSRAALLRVVLHCRREGLPSPRQIYRAAAAIQAEWTAAQELTHRGLGWTTLQGGQIAPAANPMGLFVPNTAARRNGQPFLRRIG